MGIRNPAWIFTKKMIVAIVGSMGSGKTTLAKKILKKNPWHFSYPLKYFSADDIAASVRAQYFPQNITELKKTLFFSPRLSKAMAWYRLEQTIHPRLRNILKNTIQTHRKGTLIIDIALPHLLTKIRPIHTILMPSPSIYQMVSRLGKRRKMPLAQSISLWNKQRKYYPSLPPNPHPSAHFFHHSQ